MSKISVGIYTELSIQIFNRDDISAKRSVSCNNLKLEGVVGLPSIRLTNRCW